MSITFSYQSPNYELEDAAKLKTWITSVIASASKRVGNISYFLCDDDYLIQVNRKFLDHDTYTDIITFDYVECDRISGDILISVERVGENAQKFGTTFQQELHRVIIHGIHHLLGQGDKTDQEAAEMRAKENASLQLLETLV